MYDDSCKLVTASIYLTGLPDDLDDDIWVKIGGKKLKYVDKEVILMKK